MTVVDIFTNSGLKVATGFERIVHGGRGDYMEFKKDQIVHSSLFIPSECVYRIGDEKTYYNEYRTIDECYVKVYEQKKTVEYADYKIGLWYVSPNDLIVGGLSTLLI